MVANNPPQNSNRRFLPTSKLFQWIILLAILVFGGWMRITVVQQTQVYNPLGPDALHYFNYAYNLVNFGVYSKDSSALNGIAPVSDSYRPPGYPLFLAFFLATVPLKYFLQVLLLGQAFLSTLALLLTFFVARAFLPVILALLVTLLTALTPHLITLNHYVLSESLYTFVLLAFLVSTRGGDSRWPAWFAIGIVFCAGGMVRPALFYFVIPMAGLIWLRRELPGRKKAALAFVVGFLLLLTPWSLRNKMVLGSWSDDKYLASSMADGIYPDFVYNGNPKTFGFAHRYDPRRKEFSSSMALVLKEIKDRFSKEPMLHFKWFVLGKPSWFWSWTIVQGAGDIFVYPVVSSPYFEQKIFKTSHRLLFSLHRLAVFLAILGSILAWLPRKYQPISGDRPLFMARLLSLLLCYMTVVHMAVLPCPRYNIPLRPELYCMALFGLWGIYRQLVDRLTPKPKPVG
ncbi:MAG: PMT 2 protein [Magnetococcales bacterium]|nr:PMT 2 protein [Magnetococcales bacterium]HIJ82919.1 hypothetical protein [Magnetococcales bacterium]